MRGFSYQGNPIYCSPMAVIKLWAGGETHRGHIRETNQDVILVEPDLGLYAVLDGMGGARARDVAARIAGEEIAASIRRMSRTRRRSPRRALELALHTAAVEVFMAAEQQLAYRGMGTTVVACLVVEPTHVVIGHAGDSRAYLLRDGRLRALTRDHTVAQRLVDAGAHGLGAADSDAAGARVAMTRGDTSASQAALRKRGSSGARFLRNQRGRLA